MISGIDLSSVVDFICKDDLDSPTIWKLGAVPSTVMAKASMKANDKDPEGIIDIVRYGLKGWDNFRLASGKVIEYESTNGRVKEELISAIPLVTLIEIGTKLFEINSLSAQERKN